MKAQAILQLILWLAPATPRGDAREYARHVADAAACFAVEVVDVLSVIQRESQFTATAVSRTRDYGLMQLHVSRGCHARYRGLEALLLEPERNIWLGVRMMAWWRSWHHRNCSGLGHHYLAHYGWGYKVPKGYRLRKFHRIRNRIRSRLARRRRLM